MHGRGAYISDGTFVLPQAKVQGTEGGHKTKGLRCPACGCAAVLCQPRDGAPAYFRHSRLQNQCHTTCNYYKDGDEDHGRMITQLCVRFHTWLQDHPVGNESVYIQRRCCGCQATMPPFMLLLQVVLDAPFDDAPLMFGTQIDDTRSVLPYHVVYFVQPESFGDEDGFHRENPVLCFDAHQVRDVFPSSPTRPFHCLRACDQCDTCTRTQQFVQFGGGYLSKPGVVRLPHPEHTCWSIDYDVHTKKVIRRTGTSAMTPCHFEVDDALVWAWMDQLPCPFDVAVVQQQRTTGDYFSTREILRRQAEFEPETR